MHTYNIRAERERDRGKREQQADRQAGRSNRQVGEEDGDRLTRAHYSTYNNNNRELSKSS
jgi:hypothetical protein